MNLRIGLVSVLLAAGINSAAAEDEGKALVDDNCYSCHGNEVYTRADRKVKSLVGLHKQVQRCELALGLGWFDDQIDASSAYLNKDFYRFK
jgi:mono/diheme cytochrome c family protein